VIDRVDKQAAMSGEIGDTAPIKRRDRDSRRVRTRAALIQAGQALFSERSVEGVSIDDIVEAAKVSKGSFYNHFEDKNALAREIIAGTRADAERLITKANMDIADPAQRTARALCVYARVAVEDPERGRLIARLVTQELSPESPVNQGAVLDVAAGLAEARFAIPTVEAGVLYILGIAQVLIARVLVEPSHAGVISITQQLISLKLRGLGLSAIEADRISARAADEILRAPLARQNAPSTKPP
jgi:AcrR family transcriptional regulator